MKSSRKELSNCECELLEKLMRNPGDSEPPVLVSQYRCSVFDDTAILGLRYRGSGHMVPFPFIINSYALQRKFITGDNGGRSRE